MYDELSKLQTEQAYMAGQAANPKRMTRRQQLELNKQRIQSQLDAVNKALEALDSHPDLEEFIETLQNANV